MKAWLKGGLIGVGIFILFYIFALSFQWGEPNWIMVLPYFPFFILNLIGINLFDFRCPFIKKLTEETLEPVMPDPTTMLLCGGIRILMLIFIWFLLGALIGWLIGRFKK